MMYMKDEKIVEIDDYRLELENISLLLGTYALPPFFLTLIIFKIVRKINAKSRKIC